MFNKCFRRFSFTLTSLRGKSYHTFSNRTTCSQTNRGCASTSTSMIEKKNVIISAFKRLFCARTNTYNDSSTASELSNYERLYTLVKNSNNLGECKSEINEILNECLDHKDKLKEFKEGIELCIKYFSNHTKDLSPKEFLKFLKVFTLFQKIDPTLDLQTMDWKYSVEDYMTSSRDFQVNQLIECLILIKMFKFSSSSFISKCLIKIKTESNDFQGLKIRETILLLNVILKNSGVENDLSWFSLLESLSKAEMKDFMYNEKLDQVSVVNTIAIFSQVSMMKLFDTGFYVEALKKFKGFILSNLHIFDDKILAFILNTFLFSDLLNGEELFIFCERMVLSSEGSEIASTIFILVNLVETMCNNKEIFSYFELKEKVDEIKNISFMKKALTPEIRQKYLTTINKNAYSDELVKLKDQVEFIRKNCQEVFILSAELLYADLSNLTIN